MLLISLGIISQYSGNALFSNYINLIYNSMGITKQGQKIPVSLFVTTIRTVAKDLS